MLQMKKNGKIWYQLMSGKGLKLKNLIKLLRANFRPRYQNTKYSCARHRNLMAATRTLTSSRISLASPTQSNSMMWKDYWFKKEGRKNTIIFMIARKSNWSMFWRMNENALRLQKMYLMTAKRRADLNTSSRFKSKCTRSHFRRKRSGPRHRALN